MLWQRCGVQTHCAFFIINYNLSALRMLGALSTSWPHCAFNEVELFDCIFYWLRAFCALVVIFDSLCPLSCCVVVRSGVPVAPPCLARFLISQFFCDCVIDRCVVRSPCAVVFFEIVFGFFTVAFARIVWATPQIGAPLGPSCAVAASCPHGVCIVRVVRSTRGASCAWSGALLVAFPRIVSASCAWFGRAFRDCGRETFSEFVTVLWFFVFVFARVVLHGHENGRANGPIVFCFVSMFVVVRWCPLASCRCCAFVLRGRNSSRLCVISWWLGLRRLCHELMAHWAPMAPSCCASLAIRSHTRSLRLGDIV